MKVFIMDQYVLLEVPGSFNFFRDVVVKILFENLNMFISSAPAFCNLTQPTISLPLVIKLLKRLFFLSISILFWMLNEGDP